MNRVRSVTVFSHTSTTRHADGKGDELLFSFYLSSLSSFALPPSVSEEKWLSSSVFSARSSSRYLIIILSAARAWLIDVPLNCLLQADDLTKALCSTWPLLFSSSKTRWLHLLFTTTPFYGSRQRNKLAVTVDGGVLRWRCMCVLKWKLSMCAFFPLTSLLSQGRLRAVQTSFCAAFISKHNNSSCMLEQLCTDSFDGSSWM